jgi:hypothetical protein
MMVLPHLRLILPFSSRYLTTAIDNFLTDMCGPGLGNHERLRGRAGGLEGPAHYGNSLGFRIVPLDGRGFTPSNYGRFVRTFPFRDRGSLAVTMRPLPERR